MQGQDEGEEVGKEIEVEERGLEGRELAAAELIAETTAAALEQQSKEEIPFRSASQAAPQNVSSPQGSNKNISQAWRQSQQLSV